MTDLMLLSRDKTLCLRYPFTSLKRFLLHFIKMTLVLYILISRILILRCCYYFAFVKYLQIYIAKIWL